MQPTTIVIPCYNEQHRLQPAAFISAVQQYAELSALFVDDGSVDATPDILESLCRQQPERLAWFRLPANAGKAEAVRQGMLRAMDGDAIHVGYWDADLATPLAEVPRLAGRLDDPAVRVVLGSRVRILGHTIERRAMRHYLGRTFATAASLLLRLPVYDTQCGAKLFRKTPLLQRILREPFRVRWTFDVELLSRLVRADGREAVLRYTIEVPLLQWIDKPGSKLKATDFIRAAGELAQIALARDACAR